MVPRTRPTAIMTIFRQILVAQKAQFRMGVLVSFRHGEVLEGWPCESDGVISTTESLRY